MSEPHVCKHEVDLALMSQNLITIKGKVGEIDTAVINLSQQQNADLLHAENTNRKMENIEKHMASMENMLKGNGGPGIVTKQALAEQAIARIWWWLGGVSLAIGGGLIKMFV